MCHHSYQAKTAAAPIVQMWNLGSEWSQGLFKLCHLVLSQCWLSHCLAPDLVHLLPAFHTVEWSDHFSGFFLAPGQCLRVRSMCRSLLPYWVLSPMQCFWWWLCKGEKVEKGDPLLAFDLLKFLSKSKHQPQVDGERPSGTASSAFSSAPALKGCHITHHSERTFLSEALSWWLTLGEVFSGIQCLLTYQTKCFSWFVVTLTMMVVLHFRGMLKGGWRRGGGRTKLDCPNCLQVDNTENTMMVLGRSLWVVFLKVVRKYQNWGVGVRKQSALCAYSFLPRSKD